MLITSLRISTISLPPPLPRLPLSHLHHRRCIYYGLQGQCDEPINISGMMRENLSNLSLPLSGPPLAVLQQVEIKAERTSEMLLEGRLMKSSEQRVLWAQTLDHSVLCPCYVLIKKFDLIYVISARICVFTISLCVCGSKHKFLLLKVKILNASKGGNYPFV